MWIWLRAKTNKSKYLFPCCIPSTPALTTSKCISRHICLFKIRFPAHRLVLSASSKYFNALLGPNSPKGTDKNVVLKNIDGATLKKVIDFIYTARITIDSKSVAAILEAASRMELVSLVERCCTFWENNLTIANCVDSLVNADKYHLNNLFPNAFEFIRKNFEAVPAADIPKIDEESFRAILNHDRLSAAETTTFERLVLWLGGKKLKKTNSESSFLKLIRLQHIPIEVSCGFVPIENYDRHSTNTVKGGIGNNLVRPSST